MICRRQLVWVHFEFTGRDEREDGKQVLVTLRVSPPRVAAPKYKKWSSWCKEFAVKVWCRFKAMNRSTASAVQWLLDNFNDEMAGLDESYLRRWGKKQLGEERSPPRKLQKLSAFGSKYLTPAIMADILLCILAVPFTPFYFFLKEWIFGKILCHLVAYSQVSCVMGI